MSAWTAIANNRCLNLLFLALLTLQTAVEGNSGPAAHRPHRGYRHVTLTHLNESETNHSSNDKHPVPPPFNLEISSYNFITTIQWEYKTTSRTPFFQVEIKNYQTGDNWTTVNNCRKISHKHCDLSKKISPRDLNAFYNVRVKAFLGTEESEYATKKDFCLRIDGIIGPPTLNATLENNNVILNIWHPLVPQVEKKLKTIQEFFDDFDYVVYVNGKDNFEYVTDCNNLGCTAYITPPSKEETICLSAQGSSKHWAVTGKNSKEICITVNGENGGIIPAPFDLKIISYNFNTTIFWKYNLTYIVPYFQVEVENQSIGNWTVVNSCRRILHNYCDLSKRINNPKYFYSVRVKALLGTQESEYGIRRDFYLRTDGIIGPPTLKFTKENDNIALVILHPLLPFKEDEQMTVADIYEDFNYVVFINSSKSKAEYEIDPEQCNVSVCKALIVPPPTEETVCLSAEGQSNHWAVTGEKSMEICIPVHATNKQSLQWVIAAILIPTLLILLILVLIFLIKNQMFPIMVPQSLRFVPKNAETLLSNHSETSEVPTSTIKVLIDTKIPEEDKIFQNDTSSITDTQEYEGEGTEYERAVVETEQQQSDEQNWTRVEPDTSSSDNNSKDSGINIAPESNEGNDEEKLWSETKCTSNSYGYDKPHVPLDLLLQEIKEEQSIESTASDHC